VYSWETDRLWRKNRQPTSVSWCKGIDLDRAYNFHFDDSAQSKGNPCSDIFPGHRPFEATESRVFSEWLESYRSNGNSIVALLDLHSYSQQSAPPLHLPPIMILANPPCE
jgi:extracellular matrix protein 14